MDSAKKPHGQLLLWVLAAVVFGLYRTLSSGGIPAAEDLARRQEEIRNFWFRIPGYPGSQSPTGAQLVRKDQIVSERLYPAQTDYLRARAFYEKELPGAGWSPIGEERDVPGLQSPVMLFRNGDYHLLMNTGSKGVLLRITWAPDLNPLVEIRAMPEQ